MRTVAGILAHVSTVLLFGCGDDEPFAPTIADVAGTYSATTFTATTAGSTSDLLAEGASLTLTLLENGATTGRLFVPDGAEGGGDLDADLAGTWTLDGTTVTFTQDADTFIRDVGFTARPNRLEAEDTFGSTTIRVVLTK